MKTDPVHHSPARPDDLREILRAIIRDSYASRPCSYCASDLFDEDTICLLCGRENTRELL